MSKVLEGKKVLITGASSGIGRATAVMLVKEGAVVCATGRNEALMKELQEECGCHIVVSDLITPGSCERIVTEAVTLMGGLTSLVNCAGVLRVGAIDNTSLETFNANFSTNTTAVFEMMQHAIPHLKKCEDGASITNVSSVNGMQSFGGVAACTSLFLLLCVSLPASRELRSSTFTHSFRPSHLSPSCGLLLPRLRVQGGRRHAHQVRRR
jgi:NAD(P)-dependent dehydrogenase (short-subunit alcohol dehydrogenase family)